MAARPRAAVLHHEQVPPPEPLSAVVERFWCFSTTEAKDYYFVPDGCFDIRIDRLDPAASVVIGPSSRAKSVRVGVVERLGVRFYPGAAGLLFDRPASEFRDLRIPLNEVLPGSDAMLEAVHRAPSLSDALPHVQRFVLERMGSTRRMRGTVSAAVEKIIATSGMIRVAELAGQLGLSRQRLGTFFRQDVGLNPKLFARIVRLRSALLQIARSDLHLAAIANDVGYFDEPHMIGEFMDLVRVTPDQYRHAEEDRIASISATAEMTRYALRHGIDPKE